MHKALTVACMLVSSSIASAQITGFVAPHEVSPSGGSQSLLNASLMPSGATVLKLFGNTSLPTVTVTATAPAIPELH